MRDYTQLQTWKKGRLILVLLLKISEERGIDFDRETKDAIKRQALFLYANLVRALSSSHDDVFNRHLSLVVHTVQHLSTFLNDNKPAFTENPGLIDTALDELSQLQTMLACLQNNFSNGKRFC